MENSLLKDAGDLFFLKYNRNWVPTMWYLFIIQLSKLRSFISRSLWKHLYPRKQQNSLGYLACDTFLDSILFIQIWNVIIHLQLVDHWFLARSNLSSMVINAHLDDCKTSIQHENHADYYVCDWTSAVSSARFHKWWRRQTEIQYGFKASFS